jgi:hypothetical protein
LDVGIVQIFSHRRGDESFSEPVVTNPEVARFGATSVDPEKSYNILFYQ